MKIVAFIFLVFLKHGSVKVGQAALELTHSLPVSASGEEQFSMAVLGVVSVAAETLACVDVKIAWPFTHPRLLLLSRAAQYRRRRKLSCVLSASCSSWQKKVLRWH